MIRELLDRRIPQFVGLYLVGSWGFLEFLDWAVDRYVLSPTLVDFVVALLLLFLPTVFVIAWRHGTPGPDEWKRTDAAMIGLNVFVAAGVLFGTFRNADLGAATTVKLVEDSEGNTVERAVPKESFRHSLLIYDIENETGNSDHEWMELGLGLALWSDLLQDPFVTGTSTLDDGVREYLAERGIEPGDDVPLSLKRGAAGVRGMDHFLAGTIRRSGDSLLVETRLYRTDTGRLLAEREYPMSDPREAADRMSLDLRRDMGIPDGQIEGSVDLPAAELLTDSPEAFRLLSEAYRHAFRDAEPAEGTRLANETLAIDSTAALAYIVLANTALQSGDQATASDAVDGALRYSYRLPERTRLVLEMQNAYLFDGDVEAAKRTGRYWAEVYPEDTDARRRLSNVYAMSGDTQGQIRELRALLALDSTDVTAMRQLAGALSNEERYDEAFGWYERIQKRRPSDIGSRLDMAEALVEAGRFDEARTGLDAAVAVAPRDPDVPRQAALLDIREGDFEAAAARLEEVRALERTAAERVRRIELEEALHYRRGRFGRVEDAYRRRLALLAENEQTLGVVTRVNTSVYLVYAAEAGRGAAALAHLDSLKALVQPPWNHMLDAPALRIHVAMGDTAAARSALTGIEEWLEFSGIAEDRRARVRWAEGAIAAIEDSNCRRALPLYDEALRIAPNSDLYRVTRLQCLTERERWREAEADAEWIVERMPGRPTYRLALARYEAARGRTAEALAHLDFALDVWADADPDYHPAQEARALRESLKR